MVPIYREHLTDDEMRSLEQLRERLPGCNLFAFGPWSIVLGDGGRLPAELRGPAFAFPDRYFESRSAYNALMFSRRLYEPLADAGYEWMLVHQLDSLVFGDWDELAEFTSAPFDFYGAPLLTAPMHWQPGRNGGLSLRRLSAALRVLRGRAFYLEPDAYYHELGVNEDLAWTVQVPRFMDGSYRVAPAQLSAMFAWETSPRLAQQLAAVRRPFGAHAWARYDRRFYEELELVPAPAGLAVADAEL